MNITQKQTGWSFFVWWAGLTILGGLAANRIADLFGLGLLSGQTDAGILLSMLGSGIFGLLVSAAQWVLLRDLFSKSLWWLVAGTLGRALGMLIGSLSIVIISHTFNLQAGFWLTGIYLTVRGAILGAAEWLILKQWRTNAGWWVLGNAIGWMLGALLLDLFIPPAASIAPIIGDIIQVAIAGAVTGAVMVWILRQPAPAPTKETEGGRSLFTWVAVWAVSWGVSWAVGWSVVRYIISSGYILTAGRIGGMVAGGIAGLIGGVGMAIVLKLAKPANGLKIYHLLILAAGWAGIVYYDWMDGFVIAGLQANQNKYGVAVAALSGNQIKYGMGGLLSGLVGGILTALILSWSARLFNWKQFGVTVLGWALGFAIGGWIVWATGFQMALNYVYGPLYGNDSAISSLILFTFISLLGGAFAGWSGGMATLSQFSIKPPPTSENIRKIGKKTRRKKIIAGDPA